MNQQRLRPNVLIAMLLAGPLQIVLADSNDTALDELSMILVTEQRVANEEPTAGFSTLSTALRFDPQVDLQSRGLPEGQSDISIQGSVFENTGIKLGAVSIVDPQTGHYTALLPIDPAALSNLTVLTGVDNALQGYNAAVATLDYRWQPLRPRRELAVGVGSDALRDGALVVGGRWDDRESVNATAAELSLARSEGDGSRANGDHEFERLFARVQRTTSHTQTDVAIALQDSFYGWPGAYTGFASLPETDRTQTRLLVANHRRDGERLDDNDTRAYTEWGAYYRDVEDDYDFDRRTDESGVPGAFDHRTRSTAIGWRALAGHGDWRWHRSCTTGVGKYVTVARIHGA